MKIPFIQQLTTKSNNARGRHPEATRPIATIPASEESNTPKEGLQVPKFHKATADNMGRGQSSFDPIRRQEIIAQALFEEMQNSVISPEGRGNLAYDLIIQEGGSPREADDVRQYVMDEITIGMLNLRGLELVPTTRELNITYAAESPAVSVTHREIDEQVAEVIEKTAGYFQRDYGFSLAMARKVAQAALQSEPEVYNAILTINADETLTPPQKLEALINRGIINDEEIVTDTDPDSTLTISTESNPVDWEALRNGVEPVTTASKIQPAFPEELRERPKPEPTVKIDSQEVVAVSQEQGETNPAVEKQGQGTKQIRPNIQSNGF